VSEEGGAKKRIIDKGWWMDFTFIPLIKFGEIRKK
jgi:hypothetical protein